ncbi:MAG TPA: MmcQ/YjbR family DNA-binding protein, partial [Anaeromyxobacter sp.]|nr:MmcQ/YjbR family DNA-binding protein [Anaeromyxobacter sp.]
ALKVRGKVFAILSNGEPGLSVSLKLPWSAEGALQFPFCEPTGYGLGRSGWVTATFRPRDAPPLDVLRSWLDESYRAVAPKRVVATLGASVKVAFPSLTRRRATERRKKAGTARRRA